MPKRGHPTNFNIRNFDYFVYGCCLYFFCGSLKQVLNKHRYEMVESTLNTIILTASSYSTSECGKSATSEIIRKSSTALQTRTVFFRKGSTHDFGLSASDSDPLQICSKMEFNAYLWTKTVNILSKILLMCQFLYLRTQIRHKKYKADQIRICNTGWGKARY
jgi:hypothetical protein